MKYHDSGRRPQRPAMSKTTIDPKISIMSAGDRQELPYPMEGNRNNIGFKIAALCDDYALSREQAIELLTEWNEQNNIGLPD